MGAFLDKPRTVKTNTCGEGHGLRSALGSMQGWRVDMEDAHVLEFSMGNCEPYNQWSFFAVFDGHAGNVAAKLGSMHIVEALVNTEQFKLLREKLSQNNNVLTEELLELMKQGIVDGFLQLDEKMREELDKGRDRSGTTAVCAIVTPSHVVIANLGDSRAVFCRKEGHVFGTHDHKPNLEKEKERIVRAGGSVMIQRINGSLAVSRAFGDFEYKSSLELKPVQQLVSPEPDVYILPRNVENDEFLLLACDGVYDVMENEELCDFVRNRLRVQDNLESVCNDVLDACLWKGSRDNMTAIVVCFSASPKINEVDKAEEDEWKSKVRTLLTETVEEEISRDDWTDDSELRVESILKLAFVHEDFAQISPRDYLKKRLAEEILDEKQIKHD
ncbi:unnamed protein product [Auanema sp. JU1783]|nr:unnamed protein product [Auanema sp. JU1783]